MPETRMNQCAHVCMHNCPANVGISLMSPSDEPFTLHLSFSVRTVLRMGVFPSICLKLIHRAGTSIVQPIWSSIVASMLTDPSPAGGNIQKLHAQPHALRAINTFMGYYLTKDPWAW